jgi:hypothetical protein
LPHYCISNHAKVPLKLIDQISRLQSNKSAGASNKSLLAFDIMMKVHIKHNEMVHSGNSKY